MIQANELMVGNLLNWSTNNEVVVVDSVHIIMCSVSQNDFNRLYKPTPITEEWLLKFGFEKHLKGFLLKGFLIKRGITMQNSIITGSNNVINYLYVQLREYAVKLEYIHQLQNLYFCICGKELMLNVD